MVVQEKRLTAADFWQEYAGQPYELIEGAAVERMPTGYLHGAVTRRVAALLGDFVDKHGLGDVVGAETGFRLSEHELCGADAAYISSAKLKTLQYPDKYLPFAPDLAVEVASPGDSARMIQDKIDLYFDAGTGQVWIIFPESRKVVVHSPDRTAKTFFEDQTIQGEATLPGLQLPVANLFPQKQEE